MKPTRHLLVMTHIFQSCKVKRSQIDHEAGRRVIELVARMHGAAAVWEGPGQIEAQLEDARAKLRGAIKAVEALDGYALSLARRYSDREREERFFRRLGEIDASVNSEDAKRVMVDRLCADYEPQPPSEYVDNNALAAMAALVQSLERPTEMAIANAPQGPGRRKNRRAYEVAKYALLIYREVTDQDVGFWEGGSTPFSRLVAGLFEIYGIKAGIKKPILEAMHEFAD